MLLLIQFHIIKTSDKMSHVYTVSASFMIPRQENRKLTADFKKKHRHLKTLNQECEASALWTSKTPVSTVGGNKTDRVIDRLASLYIISYSMLIKTTGI